MSQPTFLQRLHSRRLRLARAPVPHYHRGPDGQATECWDEACDHPHLSLAAPRPAWARRAA